VKKPPAPRTKPIKQGYLGKKLREYHKQLRKFGGRKR
jgi:hypothetical protein